MKHSNASDSNKERSQEKEVRKDCKQKIVLFVTFVHSLLQAKNSSVAAVTSSNACSKVYGRELKDTA
jgi:hypothetical protein